MAQHLAANKGTKVRMWVMEADVVESINQKHENKFLAGVKLHENITATCSVEEAVAHAGMIFLIIPTPFIGKWVERHQNKLPCNVPIVCCSKGIEQSTLRTPYEILVDEFPGKFHDKLAVISGPSFAKEVAAGLPTNVTCAAVNPECAKTVQGALSTSMFRVYTGSDIIGAELCGAVKNVLAIACGTSDGLGFGMNARAGLITRGLAEMARLVVKKGGKTSTVTGLAGVGDVVLTCSSSLSRNFTVGQGLAQGKAPDAGSAVAEGVETSRAINKLAKELGVDMPVCQSVYQVVHEGLSVKEALANLQSRPLRSEDDDVFAAEPPHKRAKVA
jgi:glycerol-3-phosphate dehydrogenase